ncbi:unnamed protein product [Phytophthora fragariaefolia]|uniref:Unnamed protein product n=1 Tax=Phytophthora fragariaefolia TaxID=1490495 RepID=A0A9W6XPP9_9STRA|nr:unnamed protein product [Phytophthora fragariaefolia]
MVSLLGEAAFAGFPNLLAEQQKARVERFDKYDSSLIAHVSAAAQEAARATMRAEAQHSDDHEVRPRGDHGDTQKCRPSDLLLLRGW